jgi:Do/DeqQ family serine protease
MKHMKYGLMTLSAAVLISGFGLWRGSKGNSEAGIEASAPVPVVRTSYNTETSTAPVDFENASRKAVASVVHIKVTMKFSKASNQQGEGPDDDFLRRFFGGDNQGKGFSAPEQKASGSGVIVGADGYIVTNNHVVENASEISVTIPESNKTYKATVVGTDPNTDLALIRIEAKDLPVMTFANSDEVKLGQWVLAAGFPLNLDVTVTQGIVSGKSRNIGINRQASAPVEVFIQTDAAINPGSSGGALVNTSGELVGINTAIASPTGAYAGYAYSIPSNLVKKVVTDIMKFGTVQRGYLGIQYAPEPSDEQKKEFNITDLNGVLVLDVDPEGAASAAGIKKGDVITKINDSATPTSPEMVGIIAGFKPGDKVKITFQRNGRELTGEVTLKNKSGKYGVVKPSAGDVLGIDLSTLKESNKGDYAVSGGVKVESIHEGIISNQTDMKPGFLITKIAGKAVKSVDEFNKVVEELHGNFQVEGVYPNSNEVYYYGINGFKK